MIFLKICQKMEKNKNHMIWLNWLINDHHHLGHITNLFFFKTTLLLQRHLNIKENWNFITSNNIYSLFLSTSF